MTEREQLEIWRVPENEIQAILDENAAKRFILNTQQAKIIQRGFVTNMGHAFNWMKSREGEEFWRKIHSKSLRKEIITDKNGKRINQQDIVVIIADDKLGTVTNINKNHIEINGYWTNLTGKELEKNLKDFLNADEDIFASLSPRGLTLDLATSEYPIFIDYDSKTEHLDIVITRAYTDYLKPELEKITTEQKGQEFNPQVYIAEEVEDIDLNIDSSLSTQNQYTQIVGNMSKLTSKINEAFKLQDEEDISKAFLETKKKLEILANQEPGKLAVASKLLTKLPFAKSMFKAVDEVIVENSSVQKNINYLFGMISDKYEKLIVVGEGLQDSKVHMEAQIKELKKLLKTSNKELEQFQEVDRPMRLISLNTQIKASVEKYKNRLVKIDAAILATQTTIVALGRDLPSLKNDLTDEMAIGGLLNSVGDYQDMFTEMSTLVSDVTESTTKKTHDVIENLFEVQIKDTHTMQYLANSAERSKKFAKMVEDKTQKLATKVKRDADFISEIVKGTEIEDARSKVKLIKD